MICELQCANYFTQLTHACLFPPTHARHRLPKDPLKKKTKTTRRGVRPKENEWEINKRSREARAGAHLGRGDEGRFQNSNETTDRPGLRGLERNIAKNERMLLFFCTGLEVSYDLPVSIKRRPSSVMMGGLPGGLPAAARPASIVLSISFINNPSTDPGLIFK